MGLSDVNFSGMKMSGSYSCQQCNFGVTDGFYDVAEKKLSWVCPKCNHRSEIKLSL